MNTDYEKIKSDLLKFGKENDACVGQYKRLSKAESIEEVIAVVKDNFRWCAKYRDFADVIMDSRELFAEHKIWVNEDVEIREGVGYLLATDGTINATSYVTSTINATSYGTSTINAESYCTSTINATSYGTSTINAESWDTSTINAESWDTSTINAESRETSTINATNYGTSTINATSRETSTMLIRTSSIKCKVKDHSIARYIYENRIVVADDSINLEIYK